MPQSYSNKRIALNTIYMYIRLFVTMAIGLYTSRVVLLILGVSDYGLFNIVGGVLALFGFITGSLGAATSRFLNAEMGKSNGDVNKAFNINQTLHVIFACIIFILAETIGLWYVYNKLQVESGKFSDAVFIYQITIFTTCAGIINTPCSSIFTAKEKYAFISSLDIINTFIRLFCIIALQYYNGNSLRFYTIIMCLTTANNFIVYHWLALRWWPEIVKIRLVKGWENYKPILSFGSWNLLSTASMMARNSGSDLIINAFFGTATNGAFAISKSVTTYVMNFSSNFDAASGPQIIQSYNAGDMERCNYLVNKMGRFSLLLFEFVLFPLWIELDFILHLWLKVVPEGVLLLCQLNLILAAVALTCGGIVLLINASGKIKWFKIQSSFFFLMCLPIGYLLYCMDYPAYTMMILFIIADLIQRIIQLVLMKSILNFNSLLYVKEAYIRPLFIALIMGSLIYVYSYLHIDSSLHKIISIIGCCLVNAFCIYFLGLTLEERKKIETKVLGRFVTRYTIIR